MINTVAILIAFTLLALPSAAGQQAQQKVPPCPPSPDSPQNYPDNMIRPKYPKDALRNGTAGAVDLKAVISPDGKIKDLVVINGDPVFSLAAEAAIRKWRFRPQAPHGQPVESVYRIQVRFNPTLREANSDVELESPPPDTPAIPTSNELRRHDLGFDIHRASEPGIVGPKPLYHPEPEFSETARKEQLQGNVDIDLVVGPDGLPHDPQIVCGAEAGLDDNALASVKQWKFTPGTKDGQPIEVEILVTVSFQLDPH